MVTVALLVAFLETNSIFGYVLEINAGVRPKRPLFGFLLSFLSKFYNELNEILNEVGIVY